MLSNKQFIFISSVSVFIVILATLTIYANRKTPITVNGNGGVVEVTIEPPYPSNTVKHITFYAKEETNFHKTKWQKIASMRGKGQKQYTFYWNTLKCHNSRYIIRANIHRIDKNVTITKAVKITNLAITQCVPENVIPYNGNPETAVIFFSIDDNDTNDPVDALVTIYTLGNHVVPVRKIRKRIPPGNQCTIQWDCMDSKGKPVEPDLYTYDVKVSQRDTSVYADKEYAVNDSFRYRSPYLDIRLGPSHSNYWMYHHYSNNGTKLIKYDDYELYTIDYTLADTKNTYASRGTIHVYDDYLVDRIQYDLAKIQCKLDNNTDCCVATKNGAGHEPYFEIPYDFMKSGGPYFTSLEIFDGHASEYRDHKPKRALNY